MRGGQEARLLGKWGERLAAEELRRRGWTVLELNYRCRLGEVDIVASDRSYLAFVEVKLRRDDRYGAGSEAVTRSKRKRVKAAAQMYLLIHPTELQPRFDVVEIYAPQGMNTAAPRISYLENAF